MHRPSSAASSLAWILSSFPLRLGRNNPRRPRRKFHGQQDQYAHWAYPGIKRLNLFSPRGHRQRRQPVQCAFAAFSHVLPKRQPALPHFRTVRGFWQRFRRGVKQRALTEQQAKHQIYERFYVVQQICATPFPHSPIFPGIFTLATGLPG